MLDEEEDEDEIGGSGMAEDRRDYVVRGLLRLLHASSSRLTC